MLPGRERRIMTRKVQPIAEYIFPKYFFSKWIIVGTTKNKKILAGKKIYNKKRFPIDR